MEFVVDKEALGKVSSEYFGFPCHSFYRLLYAHHPPLSGAGKLGQVVADVPSGLKSQVKTQVKQRTVVVRALLCLLSISSTLNVEAEHCFENSVNSTELNGVTSQRIVSHLSWKLKPKAICTNTNFTVFKITLSSECRTPIPRRRSRYYGKLMHIRD
jgi:hypothetical protein